MGNLSDFKNFTKEQTGSNLNYNKKSVSEEDLRKKYNQYKDMDNSQLSNELIKEVGRQKMAGTFDYDRLESMVEGLRGSLPEENYRNIKRILEGLK